MTIIDSERKDGSQGPQNSGVDNVISINSRKSAKESQRAVTRSKKLTRGQKFVRRGLPVIGLSAASILTGLNVVTDGGVTPRIPILGSVLENSKSHQDQEISSKVFDVDISAYPSNLDPKQDAIVLRTQPNTGFAPLEIDLPMDKKGVLVYGRPYPGPNGDDLIGEKQRAKTKEVQEKWEPVLKENGITGDYWSFRKGDQNYGVWLKVALEKPVQVDGKLVTDAYLSLNQVLPVSDKK